MNGNESSRAEAPGTFNSLHSRESENAGNISSYFSIAICGESAASSEKLQPYFPHPRTEEQREKTHLRVELVHDEMAEGGFEEVLLGAVLQQRVVHRVGSNLETNSLQCYKRKKNKPKTNK